MRNEYPRERTQKMKTTKTICSYIENNGNADVGACNKANSYFIHATNENAVPCASAPQYFVKV